MQTLIMQIVEILWSSHPDKTNDWVDVVKGSMTVCVFVLNGLFQLNYGQRVKKTQIFFRLFGFLYCITFILTNFILNVSPETIDQAFSSEMSINEKLILNLSQISVIFLFFGTG